MARSFDKRIDHDAAAVEQTGYRSSNGESLFHGGVNTPNDSDQLLATLGFPSGTTLSRVRCITWFDMPLELVERRIESCLHSLLLDFRITFLDVLDRGKVIATLSILARLQSLYEDRFKRWDEFWCSVSTW